jgi:hypothetical protein
MSKSPEFASWEAMITRCYNQRATSYPNYGARGITVCDEWRASFATFFADMGPRPTRAHSIDRIDNERGYTPSNCRWATPAEQSRNKRNTVRAPGYEVSTVKELADKAGITEHGMWQRIKSGKSPDMLRPSLRRGSISHNGTTDTIRGWAKRTGINYSTITKRLQAGWSVERALTGVAPC